MAARHAIRVQCVKDVIIRNNDFADPASSAPKGVEKLIIENSDNVVVEENRGLPKGGGRSVRKGVNGRPSSRPIAHSD